MISEDLEVKDIQTGQIRLSDSGNEGMELIAFEMEKAMNALIAPEMAESVRVQWLNFREKFYNTDGKQGSFRIRLIRKRQPQCN